MPVAAPTPCKECVKRRMLGLSYDRSGYCEKHAYIAIEQMKKRRKRQDAKREAASKRGYGRPWEKVRAAYLYEVNGLCEECKRQGKLVGADTVHHKDHNQFNNDPSNLEALCRDHHEMRHGRLKRPRGGPKV